MYFVVMRIESLLEAAMLLTIMPKMHRPRIQYFIILIFIKIIPRKLVRDSSRRLLRRNGACRSELKFFGRRIAGIAFEFNITGLACASLCDDLSVGFQLVNNTGQ